MGIEPTFRSSGSVRFGQTLSSGSVRFGKTLSSGSVRFGKTLSSGSVRFGKSLSSGSVRFEHLFTVCSIWQQLTVDGLQYISSVLLFYITKQ